jgi:hypothetical protein
MFLLLRSESLYIQWLAQITDAPETRYFLHYFLANGHPSNSDYRARDDRGVTDEFDFWKRLQDPTFQLAG